MYLSYTRLRGELSILHLIHTHVVMVYNTRRPTRTKVDSPLTFFLRNFVRTGYDNGRAITSNDMVSLLTAEQQEQRRGGSVREVSPIFVDWDPLWREHIMSYRRQHDGGRSSTEHVATFPTLAFVQVLVVDMKRVSA